jgi:hypothetical protein
MNVLRHVPLVSSVTKISANNVMSHVAPAKDLPPTARLAQLVSYSMAPNASKSATQDTLTTVAFAPCVPLPVSHVQALPITV